MIASFRKIILAACIICWNGEIMAEELGLMRTWCAGRFTFELPERFIPVEAFGSIQGASIENLGAGRKGDAARFAQDRSLDLKSGHAQDDGVGLVFKEQQQIGDIYIVAFQLNTSSLGIVPDEWSEEAYSFRDENIFRLSIVTTESTALHDRARLVDMAQKIRARQPNDIPPTTGACLPDAFLPGPMQSESHGLTFTLDGLAEPLGIRIEVASRLGADRPLDLHGDIPAGRPIRIAGMDGQVVRNHVGEIGMGAVVVRQPSAQSPAIKLTVEYFDERPDYGIAPITAQEADLLWDRYTQNIREMR